MKTPKRQPPPRPPKTVLMTVRVKRQLADKLRSRALREHRSVSNLLSLLLERAAEEDEEEDCDRLALNEVLRSGKSLGV
ncbi:MAG: hypothetical protein KGI71_05555 [Patescibacteria group bacterium]|nr:hypothetical protein [Patescibacteria group bacterium]